MQHHSNVPPTIEDMQADARILRTTPSVARAMAAKYGITVKATDTGRDLDGRVYMHLRKQIGRAHALRQEVVA